MYAIVRELIYDPQKLAQAGEQLDEFQRVHQAQPGFVGSMTVEVASGHQIVINLWQTEADSNAGREALGPVVNRIQAPLLAAPSRLIGAGAVIYNSLAK